MSTKHSVIGLNDPFMNQTQPQKSNTCLWVVVVALVICLVGLGIGFGLYVGSRKTEEVTTSQGLPFDQVASLRTPLGMLLGRRKQRTVEYLGVPYALPPVGARRWARPEMYNVTYPSPGLLATEFKPSCYQGMDVATQPTGMSEDCLYLNIFTLSDRKNRAPAPVLVFFHGGGGMVGGAAQSVPLLYNGTNLIYSVPVPGDTPSAIRDVNGTRNLVVVTVNYRLDIFAMLYLEQLYREDNFTSGTYAYLDVQMSLKWIKANIARFGGDPNNVVTFGESAGANLAASSLVVQGSEGLIHGVISESGTFGLPNELAPLSEGLRTGPIFLGLAKCATGTDQEVLKCIRDVPSYTVLQLAGQIGTGFQGIRGVVDGKLLIDFPSKVLQRGLAVNKVPVFYGHNLDDAFVPMCSKLSPTFDVTEPRYNGALLGRLNELGIVGTFAQQVLTQFPYANCAVTGDQPQTLARCCKTLENITLDFVWRCNERRVFGALAESTTKPNVFQYLFAQPPSCPRPAAIVDHTDELAYVFSTTSHYLATGLETPCEWSNEEKMFSYKVTDMWAYFATHHNPSPGYLTLPPVKRGTSENGVYLSKARIAVEQHEPAWVAGCNSFWDPFSDSYFT